MNSPFIVRGEHLDRRYTVLEATETAAKVRVQEGKTTPRGGFRTLRQKTSVFNIDKLAEIYSRRETR